MKIEHTQEQPAFQPVSITLTFTSAEELNTFTDFMVKVASSPVSVTSLLRSKVARRLPKMCEAEAGVRLFRPLVSLLKSLTVRPK